MGHLGACLTAINATSFTQLDWVKTIDDAGAGGNRFMLLIDNVKRSFYGVHALNGASVTVPAKGITGLIGPNGAGKTTLFNCISGVIPPDSGTINFDDRDITGLRPDQITRAGLVRTFQIARGLPRLSVLDNLMLYGPSQPGERIWPALFKTKMAREREDVLRERAVGIANRLNLTRVIRNPASELSGGQKKLLEIGRALMAEPKMILLDEPVAGVNPTLAREIGEHLAALIKKIYATPEPIVKKIGELIK